jgi:malate dehydrogenase (oxaloacetate-decarboxylating)(NADP+)
MTSNKETLDKEALEYHQFPRPGKLEIHPTKPCNTEKALSLAYSPGVATPCIDIAKNPLKVYDYTIKGNLVAVISNGTAVLGLGNIGPHAAKPVMEGKGILFKQFAGIDVFDLELNAPTVEGFVQAVKTMEPTFGGINLEDIKAPECFEIEERLKAEMKIPVFHDDQHGTAIICGAALINACMITKRNLADIQVVFNGAGASANSCATIFVSIGVKRENIIMCDSQGVIYRGRKEGMNKYKEKFASLTEARNLTQALKGADVFVGLSVAGAVTGEMLKGMTANPIVFAMANPDPEILPEDARKARPDIIIATGRSDFPNQVNNVLGFPSIFRGALDTRSTQINEEMKLAAVKAIAELAREDVPEKVSAAYGGKSFKFGKDYLIPKPFDTRVLLRVAPAVAKAAIESKVAQRNIDDWSKYNDQLEAIQGPSKVFIRSIIHRVQSHVSHDKRGLPKIVFPEGSSIKILKALNTIMQEDICEPILLGDPKRIKDRIKELDLPQLDRLPIIHPINSERQSEYAQKLYEMRQRKGVTLNEAERLMSLTDYYAAMMVHVDEADGMITGSTQDYANAVKPILQVIGVGKDGTASGVNFVVLEDRFILLCDTTMNINPNVEQLVTMAHQAARVAKHFHIEPRIAMLSYSNFGSNAGETPLKMRQAAEMLRKKRPSYLVDGDIQADTAVNSEIIERIFPFCRFKEGANILVFPNLEASNIAYKLLQQLGKVEVIGPFLMGVRKAANVLQRTTTVESIVNSIVLTSLEAQYFREYRKAHNNRRTQG